MQAAMDIMIVCKAPHLDVTIISNEQVFWLEVSVHQVSVMQVLQSQDHTGYIEAGVSLL